MTETMRLRDMLENIDGITLRGDAEVPVLGVAYDSRRVRTGDLFVAIKGNKEDGARFIREAIGRGAVAVAGEREVPDGTAVPMLLVPDARRFVAEAARLLMHDPASRMQLVAVTGTNGKTTICWLMDAIFRQAGLHACLAGTLGMKIGGRLEPGAHTTPEAVELVAFLARALDAECTHGVMEVSSHALAFKRAWGTRFSTAVFTNLTPEHLDFHADMESYYQAKRLLFAHEGGHRLQSSVINVDDPYGRRLAGDADGKIWRYGWDEEAEIRPLRTSARIDGSEISLAIPGGRLDIRTRLAGRPNIYNIMAAAGAALSLGIGPDAIRAGIESLSGVPGRMEFVDAGQDFTVIVDYAHTPDALEKLLENVKALTPGRRITVFGCGGDRDRTKRPRMGEIASRLSAFVIATSDNPRTEDPLRILQEIEPGLKQGPAPYRLQPDRRAAIREALEMARPGDVVLLAGKGHENVQIIGNQALPFEDRGIARELLLQLKRAQGD